MKEELITYEDPKSPISEIFRTLRTNIQFMASNKKMKTILITSSVPGEGKSWVSSNLILAFAQQGKKVIIVDSDMRKGRLHSIFEVDKKPGLSNYLSGIVETKDKDNIFNYIRQTKIANLYVMPSGDIPPNPSELLVSEKTKTLIDGLKNMFDIVIFDGTPALIVTDALILARQVDATLIVTSYKTTKMGDIEKIKKSIENVGGNIIGIVINKIEISAKKYENSYYYGHKNKTKEDLKKVENKEYEHIKENMRNRKQKESLTKQNKQETKNENKIKQNRQEAKIENRIRQSISKVKGIKKGKTGTNGKIMSNSRRTRNQRNIKNK